jgi:hypothetical protein
MLFIHRHAVALVATLSLAYTLTQRAEHDRAPITIDSHLFKIIDGKIKIAKLMFGVAKLKHLQTGEGPEKKGKILFKGHRRTLKELIEIEHKLDRHHGHHEDREPLRIALVDAIKYVKESVEPFRADIARYRKGMGEIIQKWSEQRNRVDTLILKWYHNDEAYFIKTYLTSCKALSHFIDDLIMLLLDVKHSCKKASQEFDRLIKQTRGDIT